MEAFSILILIATVCNFFLIAGLFRSRNVNVDGKVLSGPKPFPLIGNLLDVDFRRLHLSVSDMVDTYGPIFQINLLGQNAVVINDVELEKKAFGSTKYGDIFNDRPDSFWGKYVCFECSDIAFANANKKTMTKRKMLHRSLKFYGDGIAHFERTNEDELLRFSEQLKLTKQCDFDMHDMVTKSLVNTLVRLLIGKSPENHDCELMMDYFEAGNYFLSGMGFVYDFIPLIRFLPGSFGKMYQKAISARDHILDRFYFTIRNHADNPEKRDEPGLVKNLIKLQDQINKNAGTELITENDMKGIISEIIDASLDTTSSVLTNAFALLLTHRHVARKIQEEIDNFVGSARMLTFSDRENMPYTMATIYEVLRYTCPVALNLPHRASNDQNFEGYFVAKDSILLANHWYIHHDPKLWNEPWVFKPERFLDDEGKLLPLEGEARRNLVAFSTGRRECPGANFGKSRVFFYLTAVLQSFDIMPASGGQLPDTDPRRYTCGTVVKVETHHCRVVPRVKP